MVQPSSEHDGHNSIHDFAPERPAVKSRQADLESVVLWLADTWRQSRRVPPWFVGTLILLIAAGGGLLWWGNLPAAPREQAPVAALPVEQQPIESPAFVP